MAILTTLNFSNQVDSNLKVGDTIYFADNSSATGGFEVQNLEQEIIKIGVVHTIINKKSIIVEITLNVDLPVAGAFIFFSKENDVNVSSITGYYAEIKMANNSTEKAELYRIEVSAPESSK